MKLKLVQITIITVSCTDISHKILCKYFEWISVRKWKFILNNATVYIHKIRFCYVKLSVDLMFAGAYFFLFVSNNRFLCDSQNFICFLVTTEIVLRTKSAAVLRILFYCKFFPTAISRQIYFRSSFSIFDFLCVFDFAFDLVLL